MMMANINWSIYVLLFLYRILFFYHHFVLSLTNNLIISDFSASSILMQSHGSRCFLFNLFKYIEFPFSTSRTISTSILLYINAQSMLNPGILLQFLLYILSDFIYWRSSLSPVKMCSLSQNVVIVWAKSIDFSAYGQILECEI